MPDTTTFGLFLTAAFVVAVTPGPGILYVLTRSLKGGRREGFASSVGNGAGGLIHVGAAAFGLSAVLMASATAFAVVKYAGAAYLVYLSIRTLLERDRGDEASAPESAGTGGNRHAFRQGVISEVLNPKAALFFLAFLPQFVDPAGPVAFQILLLGCVSVSLSTGVDLPHRGLLRRAHRSAAARERPSEGRTAPPHRRRARRSRRLRRCCGRQKVGTPPQRIRFDEALCVR